MTAEGHDDYIDRTIATVRIHGGSDNSWPQWANIFADEIERLRAKNRLLQEEIRVREESQIPVIPRAAQEQIDRLRLIEGAARRLVENSGPTDEGVTYMGAVHDLEALRTALDGQPRVAR